MQLFSAPRDIALGATLCVVLGVSVLIALAISAQATVLVLPANAFLVATLLIMSGAFIRVLILTLSALAFAAAAISAGNPLACATAFAFVNSVEIVLACYLLWKFHDPHLVVGRSDAHGGGGDLEVENVTGLVNRRHLVKQIDAVRSHGNGLALLLIDLDNFKYVNDTLGHNIGDLVLSKIAGRLRGCVRRGDVVAHLGGDEFAILLIDTRHPLAAELAAHRISDTIGAPILLDGQDVRIGASIGVASWRADIDSANEFLRRADIALNVVKMTSRGSFKFFDLCMDKDLRQRRELEQDLRQALAEHAFEVHYQPIIHLPTKEVIAFEALVRWRHPTRGLVSPSAFVPVAEELGLIASIGDWVLRRACRDAVAWPEHVKVSVNYSRAQFEAPNAKTLLETALAEAGLPPNRLQLEITETTVMSNIERAHALLGELRDLGVEIAMDDFGTGYSSLGCLRSCPFDRLKIDRAFIQDLTTSLEARAILTMIIKLATTLGMHTTAEGVETPEQFEILREEGCGAAQGFYFSPAIAVEQLAPFFQLQDAGADTAA